MEESVMQQHLVHYKQATESAREDLAALQAKYQRLQTQLQDCQSKSSSQEAVVLDMREAIDRHKETEARQTSLISSLRERIHNTEQEINAIASSKSIMDMKLQVLTKENEEMKRRQLQMEIKSKEYLGEWDMAKQQASDLQARWEELVSRLASKLSIDVDRSGKPTETIVSLVDQCCKERDRQKTQISALEESVKCHEVESKASRETVRRLVADVDREQKISAARVSDLNSVRQELEHAMLREQSLEEERRSLGKKLQERELALAAVSQEYSCHSKHAQDLEHTLLRCQNEVRALQSRTETFRKEVEVLLGAQSATALTREEHILERLREICRKEKSSNEAVAELEARLAEGSCELAKQTELLRATEVKARHFQSRMQELETELLTAGVSKDGLRDEKQQYLQFLEQLSERMKIERVATDLGFDMRLEALLTRAEQLTRQEGSAVVETKTLVYSLQKKVKEQRERLESKELHIVLLRRKVAQLEEEKRSRSALAVERDDATLASRKLQKKVEHLQAQLSVMCFSSTELKAQLSHTNELKIRVMEQSQTIEEQSKCLDKLEKNKAKVAKRLSTVKTELQNQEYKASHELQQAQRILHGQASTMAELAHREKQLLDFCIVVSQMLGVDMPSTTPSSEVIKRLEVLIHSSCLQPRLACQCGALRYGPYGAPVATCSTHTAGPLVPEPLALSPPPSRTTP
ncbi:coiled-coil domain-containing protein 170-like [Brachyhypopomus gauderio]|uniref:coiled-coil domain-containing protein 170-like n=1 Tax=Brachyhypopomus gauderio TaxID=698409 RepID=UPI004042C742